MATTGKPLIYWFCLDCEARGTTTGGERGADAKHVEETRHPTMTSTQMGFGVTCPQED